MKARSTYLVLMISLLLLWTGLTPSAHATRVFTENNFGEVITIKRGEKFDILLNSTFWVLKEIKGVGISKLGKIEYKPIPPGPQAPEGCKLPGMGCGTITLHLRATKLGRVDVQFTREQCGEVIKCSAAERKLSARFRVRN